MHHRACNDISLAFEPEREAAMPVCGHHWTRRGERLDRRRPPNPPYPLAFTPATPVFPAHRLVVDVLDVGTDPAVPESAVMTPAEAVFGIATASSSAGGTATTAESRISCRSERHPRYFAAATLLVGL